MEKGLCLDNHSLSPLSCLKVPSCGEACLAYLIELRIGQLIDDVGGTAAAAACSSVGTLEGGLLCWGCALRQTANGGALACCLHQPPSLLV